MTRATGETQKTTIAVRPKTKMRIAKEKRSYEIYDDVVSRLMDELKERRKDAK